jgi:hypothetical protein
VDPTPTPTAAVIEHVTSSGWHWSHFNWQAAGAVVAALILATVAFVNASHDRKHRADQASEERKHLSTENRADRELRATEASAERVHARELIHFDQMRIAYLDLLAWVAEEEVDLDLRMVGDEQLLADLNRSEQIAMAKIQAVAEVYDSGGVMAALETWQEAHVKLRAVYVRECDAAGRSVNPLKHPALAAARVKRAEARVAVTAAVRRALRPDLIVRRPRYG